MKPLIKIIISYIFLILSETSFFIAGFQHKFVPYNCDEPRIYPLKTVLICLLIGVLAFVIGLILLKGKRPTKRLTFEIIGIVLLIASSCVFFLAGVYFTDVVYSCDTVYFPFLFVAITMLIGLIAFIFGLILFQKGQNVNR